jgi:ATP-dependent helicase IRC3
LRLSPESGKKDCLIVDVVDSVGRANGMVVSPTLFGLTHDELAQEERDREEARSETGGESYGNI